MRKFIGIILLVISFIWACIGGMLLYQKFNGYKENEAIYDDVASIAVREGTGSDITVDGIHGSGNIPNGSGLDSNKYKNHYDGTTIDWEVLKGKNVVAWIMFEKDNEVINYPVVQGKDNAYYLHHAYDGTYNANGAVFMNSNNDHAFRDMNTIIYGHNLRSGRMFGTLKRYLEKNNGKKLKFYIYTPDGRKRTYEMISVAETKDGGYAYGYSFSSVGEYREYLSHIKKDSAYDTGYNYDVNKRVVTLSTCRSIGSAQGWRVVIVGKEAKVEIVQEAASWYKKPKDDIVTILDIEKSVERTSLEITDLKKKRKEEEIKVQKIQNSVQMGSQPDGGDIGE